MAYEMNNGDLPLWANDRKESDRHPDYKGKALINGTIYDVALWSRTDRNGNQYFSGKIEVRNLEGSAERGVIQGARNLQRQQAAPAQAQGQRRPLFDEAGNPADDDLPFTN